MAKSEIGAWFYIIFLNIWHQSKFSIGFEKVGKFRVKSPSVNIGGMQAHSGKEGQFRVINATAHINYLVKNLVKKKEGRGDLSYESIF